MAGTDAVSISCQVIGLTVALENVKWTTHDGIDVETLTGYTVNDGTLEDDNSQTTTLTVTSSRTDTDATYNCVMTPAYPDDTTPVSTSVELDIYSKLGVYRLLDVEIEV